MLCHDIRTELANLESIVYAGEDLDGPTYVVHEWMSHDARGRDQTKREPDLDGAVLDWSIHAGPQLVTPLGLCLFLELLDDDDDEGGGVQECGAYSLLALEIAAKLAEPLLEMFANG